jgi:hypothetical protein
MAKRGELPIRNQIAGLQRAKASGTRFNVETRPALLGQFYSILCNLNGMHVQFISEDYVPGSPIELPESSLTDLLCFKRSESHRLFPTIPSRPG